MFGGGASRFTIDGEAGSGGGGDVRFSAAGKYSDWAECEVIDFRLWVLVGGEPVGEPREAGCSSVLDFDCEGGLAHSVWSSTGGTIEPV